MNNEIISLTDDFRKSFREDLKDKTREELVEMVINLMGNHNVLVQKLNLAKTFPDGNVPSCFHLNANGVMGIF